MKATLIDLVNQAYPEEGPRMSSQTRVTEMALAYDREHAGGRIFQRRLRMGLLVGAVAGALVCGIAFRPQIALAYQLRQMNAAVSAELTLHMTVWQPNPDGTRSKARELWKQGDEWRFETAGGRDITVFTGGNAFYYEQGAKIATFSPSDKDPFGKGGGDYSGDALLSEIESWGWKDKIRVDHQNGQTIIMRSRDSREGLRLWIDERTNLPVKFESLLGTPVGWRVMQVGEFSFAEKLAQSLFAPHFGKSVKIIDLREGKKEIAKPWETPLGRVINGRDQVSVRDVKVNSHGDVFLLYTADYRVLVPNLAVTDDLGIQYVSMENAFSPFGMDIGEVNRAFLYKGRQLKGALFVPLRQTGRLPHQIYIQFGKQDDRWRPNEDVNRVRYWSGTNLMAPLGKGSVASIDVRARRCGELPAYMPFMGMKIAGIAGFEAQKANARAWALMAMQRWPEAEIQLRTEIVRQEEQDRQWGSSGVQPDAYFNMYRVLASQGKHEEALTWLREVRVQMLYENDWLSKRVNEALDRERIR